MLSGVVGDGQGGVHRLDGARRHTTVALERLYALLSERPAGGGKRRAKPSPAQLAELQKTTAYKARVARAAKRYGVPLAEWLERFGPLDKLPPGVPRPAPSLPVAPYRRTVPPR